MRDCVDASVSLSFSLPALPCVTVSCEGLCAKDCVYKERMSDCVYIRDCVQPPAQCPAGGFTHSAFRVIHRPGSSPAERGDSIKLGCDYRALRSSWHGMFLLTLVNTALLPFALSCCGTETQSVDSLHPEKGLAVVSQEHGHAESTPQVILTPEPWKCLPWRYDWSQFQQPPRC